MVQQISTNTFGCAKWIVSSDATQGTHTTIAGALTSSSSGDTIFIRPGTYTENLTLKAGVNLTAFGSDSSINATGKVIISGTCTFTAAGSVSIYGIQLQTNSATLLAVTGSAASIVNLYNCYLNITNNTGISFTSSDAGATIYIFNCEGNIGTTGIAIYSMSATGGLVFNNCYLTNSGASTTASSNSAGNVNFGRSNISSPISTSSGGVVGLLHCEVDCSAQNATCFTTAGTGASNTRFCTFNSGSGSAVSVGSGTTLTMYYDLIGSSNTNAIAGAGTLSYAGVIFAGSSSKISTTTQTGGLIQGGVAQAPTAGFIGEQMSSNVTAIALVSATAKTLTSITLTAGIWDISCCGEVIFVGGGSLFLINISTTTNTVTGTQGSDWTQVTIAAMGEIHGSITPLRVTITTSTTYYLVMRATFVTSGTAYGRISATRVG